MPLPDEPLAKRFKFGSSSTSEQERREEFSWSRTYSGTHHDWTIQLFAETYHVHRLVLARNSDYFAGVLRFNHAASSGGAAISPAKVALVNTKNEEAASASSAAGVAVSSGVSGSGGTGATPSMDDSNLQTVDAPSPACVVISSASTACSDLTDLLAASCEYTGDEERKKLLVTAFDRLLDFMYADARSSFLIRVEHCILLFQFAEALGCQRLFDSAQMAMEIYANSIEAARVLVDAGKYAKSSTHYKGICEMCTPVVIEFFRLFAKGYDGVEHSADARSILSSVDDTRVLETILASDQLGVAVEESVFRFLITYEKKHAPALGTADTKVDERKRLWEFVRVEHMSVQSISKADLAALTSDMILKLMCAQKCFKPQLPSRDPVSRYSARPDADPSWRSCSWNVLEIVMATGSSRGLEEKQRAVSERIRRVDANCPEIFVESRRYRVNDSSPNDFDLSRTNTERRSDCIRFNPGVVLSLIAEVVEEADEAEETVGDLGMFLEPDSESLHPGVTYMDCQVRFEVWKPDGSSCTSTTMNHDFVSGVNCGYPCIVRAQDLNEYISPNGFLILRAVIEKWDGKVL